MSEVLILTVVPLINGSFLHWKQIMPASKYYTMKKLLDRREKSGYVFNNWRKIIREVKNKGRSCMVRILCGVKDVKYDRGTDTYTTTPVIADWLKIRFLNRG